MNHLRSLSVCLFVLSFVPSPASADEPSVAEWARQRIDAGLLQPLAARKARRFTRERPPPEERRARVDDAALARDKQDREFIPFSVDVRYGGEWQQNDIVGCAYRGSGKLFVRLGTDYYPAARLLGKNVAAVAGVCQAAPSRA